MEKEGLKFDYELAACNTFLSLYDKEMVCLRHGDSILNEPDFVCSKNTGIELVGIYDSENQAKKLWNNQKPIKKEHEEFNLASFQNLYRSINDKLQKLNNNLYDGYGSKKILVCDILSPYVTEKDINIYLNSYVRFKRDGTFVKYFDEIWLLYKIQKNKYKIIRLE